MAGAFVSGTNYSRISEAIREAIVSGELKQGERLKVQELSTRFGVSTNPIREALQQLQGEGLIELAPNRGAMVRVIDRKLAQDMFEIREALDGLLARRAAVVATPEDVEELRKIDRQLIEARKSPRSRRLLRLKTFFHEKIGAIAGNEEAVRLRRSKVDLFRAIRANTKRRASVERDLEVEHAAIIDAIAAGDADAAEAAARRHARASAEEVLSSLDP